MNVVGDFESRPHKAVTFVVVPGYSGGRLPGRSTKEKGRADGEEDEGCEEGRVRDEMMKEVIVGIQKRAIDESAEKKRTSGQGLRLSWGCSQFENEDEEESWQEGDQMAAQREEEQELEEIMERRRMEGSSLQLNVMQQVSELMANERMSQGNGEGFQRKEERTRWSSEEMKEKPNLDVVEDTEEMRKWRGLSQSETDLCWKKLVDRVEEEVLHKYKVEDSKRERPLEVEVPSLEWRRCAKTRNTE